jgi:hypothetical protein
VLVNTPPDLGISSPGRRFFRVGLVGLDEWLSIGDMLKATPATDGDTRVLYLEASNEARDYQGEVVMAKALAESADYYEKYGNFDIQHRSMIGLATGDPDYHMHEIGRPEQVRVDAGRTFVKGIIFSGDTPVAHCANQFWDSLTKLQPAQRWYPSVGGKIQEAKKSMGSDGQPHRAITKVLWSNVGFSRTPVNPKVPQVSTIPFGILAKCWGPDGLDLEKAVEAGYGTDSALLSGGAAIRKQSLDKKPQSYWAFRDRLAGDVMAGLAGASHKSILMRAREYGLDDDAAESWSAQFAADLKSTFGKEHH